ncbi:chemotaxis protein CheD [Rariglobus hedericola]|uniref:Probable chemoreceptor glutamine deamidase CheD n=1 Tax=Rariglobus hedericola TaxID=2597822 RepID=A0A556QPU9_9BACT|nr:chemotaxis protein CheD [Rariglobus hedericola]TSJ78665.1 chemotaxis protein CheD [Rariglobus hedericola]
MAGSPTISMLFAQRVVIGVGDIAVSNNNMVTLTTYALGSCIGVVAYDPVNKAGGMFHLMLPDSSISAEKACKQPAMFADTGLPLFLRELAGVKADRNRIKIYLAGGACVLSGPDTFKIGERNSVAIKSLLAAQGLRITGSDLAGTLNRTLHLELATGLLTVKLPDRCEKITLN